MNREKILFLLYVVVVLLLVLKVANMGKKVSPTDVIVHLVVLVLLGLLIGACLSRVSLNENFMAPLGHKMGEWSGVKLTNEESGCDWRHPPCNEPLNPDVHTFTKDPTVDFRGKLITDNDANAPSVDGNPDSKRNLFILAHNKCSPDCCPSTYSCGKGCICTTEDQRNYITGRGIMKA